MAKKKLQQIDYACKVGDRVFYKNFKGEKFEGTLIEWHANIAVIEMDDGTQKSFTC